MFPQDGALLVQNLTIQTTNKSNLETLGIKSLGNKTTMDDRLANGYSASFSKPFKTSTPADNVTAASEIVRLRSATRSLSIMTQRPGARAKEEEALLQRINVRLDGLEEDGAGIINKLENWVEELLGKAREAVVEWDTMPDKMTGYSAVSQQLVNVEDEFTLLSVNLSQWLNFTLYSRELDIDSNHIDDSVLSHDNMVMDGRKHAKADILEGDLESSDSVDVKKHEENADANNGNNNCSKEELNRNMSITQIEKRKLENNNPESLYYSPLQIKKLQNIDIPIPGELKLKLKALKIYRTDNELKLKPHQIFKTNNRTSRENVNLRENKENKLIEQDKTEKRRNFKNNEMSGDIEILPSPVLSSEKILNETPVNLEKKETTEKMIKDIEKPEKLVASLEGKINVPLGGYENCETAKPTGRGDGGVATIENITQKWKKLDTGFASHNFYFTEGCPSLFWIHLDTPSLDNLQTHLDATYKRGEGDRAPSGLEVGSSVLAKFAIDGKFYRARVEEVISKEDCVYHVRYTDYGNSAIVTGKDIQSWDSELELVPDQAVSCRLADAPSHWKQTTWTKEQLEVFYQIVDQSSGQLSVELGTRLREAKSLNFMEPMFEVVVHEFGTVDHSGANLVESLREHRSFANAFHLPEDANATENSASSHKMPLSAPTEPGSPVPSNIAEKAKSKVRNWLNFKCQEEDETTVPSQVSSVKSSRPKLCPNSAIQSKVKSIQSVVRKEEDLKTPPHNLGSLKILVDENCSFVYSVSRMENPGKFYVQPLQEEHVSLSKIHKEIGQHSPCIPTPDEHLVVPGTVWCLFNQVKQRWCRVRVESRSSSSVSVRSIDDGISQHGVGFGSLGRLPDSWVRHHPGLAVRCHMVGCNPKGKVWDPKSTAKLKKLLGDSKQHRAIVVKEENGSVGLVLLAEGNVVNQQMVEWGFAVSDFMDMFHQFRKATTTN